jgi:hypothetical protein
MSDQSMRLGAVLAALLAAAMWVGSATGATPTIVRDTITTPISMTGLTDDCRPGITGDLSGTDVTSYQSVENATGFHINGTDVGPGRIDWSDGSYTLIQSLDRFAFNAVAEGAIVVSNLTHVDTGYTYAADGTFLSYLTFRSVERVTIANGVLRVEFERGHFHVVGTCG